jgi:NADP-reducing hydrogenase subunit HndB
MKRIISLREGEGRVKILVHMGTCGIAAGARTVMTALMEEVEKRDLRDVIVNISSCAGLCSREPMMTVELQGEPPVKYVDLTADKARDILEKHILAGHVSCYQFCFLRLKLDPKAKMVSGLRSVERV